MRDISLHLMDIVQNSINANATKVIIGIFTDENMDKMRIEIEDDGQGMNDELLMQVKNPFMTTRTTRKVGLGLPLLDASAKRAGGKLSVKSEKGKGTIIQASFQISHIDRIPLGDVSETMMTLIAANPGIDFQLVLGNMKESFHFRLAEIKAQIGEFLIGQIEVLMWIKQYINKGITEIFGGVLSEIHS